MKEDPLCLIENELFNQEEHGVELQRILTFLNEWKDNEEIEGVQGRKKICEKKPGSTDTRTEWKTAVGSEVEYTNKIFGKVNGNHGAGLDVVLNKPFKVCLESFIQAMESATDSKISCLIEAHNEIMKYVIEMKHIMKIMESFHWKSWKLMGWPIFVGWRRVSLVTHYNISTTFSARLLQEKLIKL